MEMSIERAHRILSNGLLNAPSEHEWCVAFKMAIETMRKYQKIQEIYERFQKDGSYYHHMAWLDVMEVVENGKID